MNVKTWDEAWKIAKEKYGDAPTSCVSCFQQCYAEPSLMQAHPLEYMKERWPTDPALSSLQAALNRLRPPSSAVTPITPPPGKSLI